MKEAKELIIPFPFTERRIAFLAPYFLYIPDRIDHEKRGFFFFKKENPIHIEFCSGNGQWIVEKAKQTPQIHWFAVEKKFARARKIFKKIHQYELMNLKVICSEGFVFTKHYCPKVEQIYINFPDPWPKRRHFKHRLIRLDFLVELQKILGIGKKVIIVTDDLGYIEQIQFEFSQFKSWKLLFYKDCWPEYGSSYFQSLWLQKGRKIHYLGYEKVLE